MCVCVCVLPSIKPNKIVLLNTMVLQGNLTTAAQRPPSKHFKKCKILGNKDLFYKIFTAVIILHFRKIVSFSLPTSTLG